MPLLAIVEAEHVVQFNAVIPVHCDYRCCNKGVVASVLVDARPCHVDDLGNSRRLRGRSQEVVNGTPGWQRWKVAPQ